MAVFKITTFTVGGKQYTDEDLLVLIPIQYKPWFEGHNFKDMHDLSMALMHAHCANEADYYKRPWAVEEHEGDLKRQLGL